MRPSAPRSKLEQTMNALREGFNSRRWAGKLPGVRPLAKELGVSVGTLQSALKGLEQEGVIHGKGSGRRRLVSPTVPAEAQGRTLRVGILPIDSLRTETSMNQFLFYGLVRELNAAGHHPFFAPKSIRELRCDPGKIMAQIAQAAADVWIVFNAEREVLETLAADLASRMIALGGRVSGLPIASVGVRVDDVMSQCVRQLLTLGHKRIVLAIPPHFRKPEPGALVRAFQQELVAAGLQPGDYHVPDWEFTGAGFNSLLRSLFALTPPTALIVDDIREVLAIKTFLAAQRSRPGRISVVMLGCEPALEWMSPRPASIFYDNDDLIRRVTRWVDHCARGRPDKEQVICPIRFLPGTPLPP